MKKCENEVTLIKEAQNGNTDAFGDLVRHYEKFVFNIAYSYMLNYDDAFDVAQESFLKVWKKLSLFEGRSSFSTWLYRITANTSMDALEKKQMSLVVELSDIFEAPDPTPEEKAIQNESCAELTKALEQLEPEERELLCLREFNSLSYAELSRYLGLELGTVKSRLSRTRNRLRKILLEQNSKNPVKIDEKK